MTQLIKQLRELTGHGIFECKEALEFCNKDMDLAILYLKEKGLAVARYRIVSGEKISMSFQQYFEAEYMNKRRD